MPYDIFLYEGEPSKYDVRLRFLGEIPTVTYDVDLIMKLLDAKNIYSTDTIFKSTYVLNYLIDVALKQTNDVKDYLIDMIISSPSFKPYLLDVLTKNPTTLNYLLDAIFKIQGTTKDYIINILLQTQSIKSYLIDMIINSPITIKDYIVDVLINRLNDVITSPIDIVTSKEETKSYLIDSFIAILMNEKQYIVDVLFNKTNSKDYLLDIITKTSNISKSYSIDIILQKKETLTYLFETLIQDTTIMPYLIDVLFRKNNDTKDYLLDILFNKIEIKSYLTDIMLKDEIIKNYIIDVIIQKENTQEYLIDVLFGVCLTDMPYLIQTIFQDAKTLNYLMETLLVESDVIQTYILDIMTAKMYTDQYFIDSMFKLVSLSSFDLDVLFKTFNMMTPYQLDTLFAQTNKLSDYNIDTMFINALTNIYSFDAVLKKSASTKTYSVDSLIFEYFSLEWILDIAYIRRSITAIPSWVNNTVNNIDGSIWSKNSREMIVTARLTDVQLEKIMNDYKGNLFGFTDGVNTIYTVVIQDVKAVWEDTGYDNVNYSVPHPWKVDIDMLIFYQYRIDVSQPYKINTMFKEFNKSKLYNMDVKFRGFETRTKAYNIDTMLFPSGYSMFSLDVLFKLFNIDKSYNVDAMITPEYVPPTGFLEGYLYRNSHIINAATGAGTNYQFRIKAVKEIGCDALIPTNLSFFMASDVDSNGYVYVGDDAYKIYKSTNRGQTFTLIYTISAQSSPWSVTAGKVWCVFVDSRDYIYVSAGSTNRVYRSTDGGANWTEVLNLSRAANDGHIISMTEDSNGDLYAAEYGNAPSARLFKSTDDGANWSSIKSWDARHLHYVRFNTYNNYLYVITGEDGVDGGGSPTTEDCQMYRSKDYGSNWQLVVQASPTYRGNLFTSFNFINNDVYCIEDHNSFPDDYSNIVKYTDDGINEPFTLTTVYTSTDKTTGLSSSNLGDWIFFGYCYETYAGENTKVVGSKDGNTWIEFDSCTQSTKKWNNTLTVHPDRDHIIYGCRGINGTYFITNSSYLTIVNTESCAKSDFSDVKITLGDGTTILAGSSNGWMEEMVSDFYANIWFKLPDDIESSISTIYIYYGNNDASWTEDPLSTFSFFDTFAGSSLDTGKWDASAAGVSVHDGVVDITAITDNYILSKTSAFTLNSMIEGRIRRINNGQHLNFGGRNDAFTIFSLVALATWIYSPTDFFYSNLSVGGSGPRVDDEYKDLLYHKWAIGRKGSSDSVKFYKDRYYDNLIATEIPSIDLKILLRSYKEAGTGQELYCDWIFIRKYTFPEPTHGEWGSKEII